MRHALIGLCFSLAASGCMLFRAAKSNETLALISTLRGDLRVTVPPGRAAFVVMLRSARGHWEVHSSRVVHGDGRYEFIAPRGNYRLFAFVDANGDLEWNESEPSAETAPRALASGETVVAPELVVAAGGPPAPTKLRLDQPQVTEELVKVHRGDVTTLDEERFGDEAASLSYWQPADFALRYGMGVSFLEPYDSKKVPVLFVHGAAGSPRNFAAQIAALDRSRFQPWVYSYPTGVRLGLVSTKLGHIVDDLHHRLKFERLMVVAHSMGGLVAKSFVDHVAGRPGQDYVRMLITLATPFNGHESAETGVKQSPVVIPSWNDMVTNSPFLVSLRSPLPASTPHHLFFSYLGGGGSGGPTDGAVSVRSMLTADLQSRAARVEGFAEDHASILTSREVIAALNASLRQGAEVLSPD